MAGLELAPLHVGLWLLAWTVRVWWVRSLEPLARPLRKIADLAAPLGSDRGGMVIDAQGEGLDGAPRYARWSLAAQDNAGPSVPVAAAAAVLQGLLDGRITQRGAQVCRGLVTEGEILAQVAHLPITTRLEAADPAPTLLRRLLGEDVERLPREVVRVHDRLATKTFSGRGRARGSEHRIAQLARLLIGLPEPGVYPKLKVTIAPKLGGAERWVRDFGSRRFSSQLKLARTRGQFEERVGPLSFRFSPQLQPDGFTWRLESWRLLGLPLPKALAPQIRARTYARGGRYRFRVLTAHRWLGVLFAYCGSLDS